MSISGLPTPPVLADAVSTPRQFDTIYRDLREAICLLDYAPGSALSENSLARHYDTSRTVIKRVLYRLEYDGLVTSTHGVGTIVTSVDLVYLQQVYALRFKLMELLEDMTANRVTESHLARIDALATQTFALRDMPDFRGLQKCYQDFSEAFSDALGNRPFREVMDRLFYQTSRVYMQVLPDMNWQQEIDIAVSEMRDVHDALAARDMARVASVRKRHMVWNLERFNHYLARAVFQLKAADMTH